MMKRSLLFLALNLAGFAHFSVAINPAEAVLVGGFNGSLDPGWVSFGDVTTTTTFNNVSPTEGTGMVRITNADNTETQGQFNLNFSGTNPLPVGGGTSSLEGQLNLPNGIFDVAGDFGFEGSAVRRTVSANAGDTLVFEWNLLTNSSDSSFNDYGFFAVNSVVTTLASTTSTSALPGSPYLQRSAAGLTTSSFTFVTPGSYAIAFGVIDVNDTVGASALLVDNVRVEPVPFQFDQEFVLGLAALSSFCLWRKFKK
jgi:hypothetical protein